MNGKGGYIFNKGDFKTLSKLFLQFYNNPKFFLEKEQICRKNLNRAIINTEFEHDIVSR